jgi:hypothetical protein
MPPAGHDLLTADERRTLIEWIDLGATWSESRAEDPRAARTTGGPTP